MLGLAFWLALWVPCLAQPPAARSRLVQAPAARGKLMQAQATDAPAEQARLVEATIGDPRQVRCLAPQAGRLWVGTLGAGMLVLDREGRVRRRIDSAQGLAGNRVQDCLWHRGRLWVASDLALQWLDAAGRVHWQARGRFLHLAAGGTRLWATDDQGQLHCLGAGCDKARRRLDAVPSALAAHRDGRWAVGFFDGRVQRGSGPNRRSAHGRRREADGAAGSGRQLTARRLGGAPIVQLAYRGGDLRIRSESRGWRARGGSSVQRDRRLGRALALDRAGRILLAQAPAGRRVQTALAWQGWIWLGTNGGLYRRPLQARAPFQPIALGGMPCGARVVALAHFDGALWVGSFDQGLCRFARGRWQHFGAPTHLPSDHVNALTTDGQRLFVATGGGLSVVDRKLNFRQHTVVQCQGQGALAGNCPWHRAVNGVAHDAHSGQTWVADLGALHVIDPAAPGGPPSPWRHRFGPRSLRSRRVTRVAARGGQMAVATGDSGVRVLRGRRLRAFDDARGLRDNWVTDLAWDAAGGLWLASCTQGVSRLKGGRLQHWHSGAGLVDDYALMVRPFADKAWVGTVRGLSLIEAGRVRAWGAEAGLSGLEIHDALRYRGRWWLATDGGLSILRRGMR